MQIIDSHHHFWKYDANDYPWIDDDLSMLQRDFGCEELENAVRGTGVSGVVSVQARTVVSETDYLLESGARCPLVRGVVGWAPLKDAGVGRLLDKWGSDLLFKGVREICQGADDGDFFDNEEFNRGIGELTRRDLPYDLLLFEDQLETVIRFVDRHPNQRFIVDHIAKPNITKRAFASNWAAGLKNLGRRGNVIACKVSGVVTEVRDPEWSTELLRPYFEAALDAFGASRLMFGSDWPVCLSRIDYSGWLNCMGELVSRLSPEEIAGFYFANAISAYDLNREP